MARPILASFYLFVALLIGVTSTNAQSIPLPTITQVNITGRIVCNPLGNPIPGLPNSPVVGANVTFSCDGGQTIIGRGVTNALGYFQITPSNSGIQFLVMTILFGPDRCRVFVPLPINGSCIFLRGSGSLQASLGPPNIVVTSTIVIFNGVILNFMTLPFEQT